MPIAADVFPLQGGCACKAVRYQMEKNPLIVHACHCMHCQREVGAAFALNAIVESEYVTMLSDVSPLGTNVPTESGDGHEIHRCPQCKTAVFGYYGDSHLTSFIRLGTLDRASDPAIDLKPDVQIYTTTKQPWLPLHPEIPQFDKFYKSKEVWSSTSLERIKDARLRAQQASAAQASNKM